MNLPKEIYKQIINNYYHKRLKSILSFFYNYESKYIKKTLIRLIIKTTLDFDLAIELNDATDISQIKSILTRVFLLDFIEIQLKIISKDDINLFKRDQIYLKFKPLFIKELNIYNNCYYQKFIKINCQLNYNFKIYPKQTLDEINFNLSFHKDWNQLNNLLINNQCFLNNLYITRSDVIFKDNIKNKTKTFQDIQLEEIILYNMLRIKNIN